MRPRNPGWLSVAAAADLLGRDASTLWRWKKEGLLDQVRTEQFGKYTYYWRPDIEALKARLDAGPDDEA